MYQPQEQPRRMSPEIELVLADAHVHLHECFEISDALDSAHKNFSAVAEDISDGPVIAGVLFLTESSSANYFEQLAGNGDHEIGSGWHLESTEESVSLIARKNESIPRIIVGGRQIVTAERLEVLALGAANIHPDGGPIRDTLESVVAADAIPVIPWGFGKWMGRRGTLLRSLLGDSTVPSFFLGDNSGRPAFIPRPAEFSQTKGDTRHILSGSDPLPFPSEFSKPGSFGFSIRTRISFAHPMRSLRNAIRKPATSLHGFGAPEPAVRFFLNQVRMQIRLRQRRVSDN